jgi:hypothetical protein
MPAEPAKEHYLSLAVSFEPNRAGSRARTFFHAQYAAGSYQEVAMFILVRGFILFIAIGMLSFPVYAAEEVSKGQIKSLDEQVQEIKSDTLETGAKLLLLEEKLLYPSSTQVAVYISVDGAATYRLDSIEIQLDGKGAAEHLYTMRELETLQKGGMQRIYAGNITTGEHSLEVLVNGKTLGGPRFSETGRFKFSKEVGPKILEVHLIDSGDHMVTLRDW